MANSTYQLQLGELTNKKHGLDRNWIQRFKMLTYSDMVSKRMDRLVVKGCAEICRILATAQNKSRYQPWCSPSWCRTCQDNCKGKQIHLTICIQMSGLDLCFIKNQVMIPPRVPTCCWIQAGKGRILAHSSEDEMWNAHKSTGQTRIWVNNKKEVVNL